jgi:type III secretory pathway component EscS
VAVAAPGVAWLVGVEVTVVQAVTNIRKANMARRKAVENEWEVLK